MTTDPGARPDPAKFDSEPTKTRLVLVVIGFLIGMMLLATARSLARRKFEL